MFKSKILLEEHCIVNNVHNVVPDQCILCTELNGTLSFGQTPYA